MLMTMYSLPILDTSIYGILAVLNLKLLPSSWGSLNFGDQLGM